MKKHAMLHRAIDGTVAWRSKRERQSTFRVYTSLAALACLQTNQPHTKPPRYPSFSANFVDCRTYLRLLFYVMIKMVDVVVIVHDSVAFRSS